MPEGFTHVAGQLVRESAVTRLVRNEVAGVTATQHYVYFVDGGVVPVSQDEYESLRKKFEPSKSRGKKGA